MNVRQKQNQTHKTSCKEDNERNSSNNKEISPSDRRHYEYRHEHNEAGSTRPE